MTDPATPLPVSLTGKVLANRPVSTGLIRLDLELPRACGFLPGQFAMLNLTDRRSFVFSRPFSILAVDGAVMSFLYRVVGRGTAAMAALSPQDAMVMLGPLGTPFPAPDPQRSAVLVAGGVGLPPVASWLARYGRPGDKAFFGARDGGDVPWNLLEDRWAVSVDDPAGLPQGREAFTGVVTALVATRSDLARGPREMFACGPEPLLEAAARMAGERGWKAWLSLEEHMGCGYGVCKGCVVTVKDPAAGPDGRRNATCCQDGPVFPADALVWDSAAGPSPGAHSHPGPGGGS